MTYQITPARKAHIAKLNAQCGTKTPARMAHVAKLNANNPAHGIGRRSKKIHPGLAPPLRFLFEEIVRQRCMDRTIATRVGCSEYSLREWRSGRHDPRISDVEACLNVLGYTLRPVPLKEDE